MFGLLCILGAWFARIDGGGGFGRYNWNPDTQTGVKVPEWIERTLCISFFVVACVQFAGWYGLFAYVGVLGLLLGHGQYFLHRLPKRISAERVDVIVKLFFGTDPRTKAQLTATEGGIQYLMDRYGMRKLYWRCCAGMLVGGTFVGLPAAILAVCYGLYPAAALFALTGVVKSLSYIIAYELFNKTEQGEMMNGFFRTALALSTMGVFFS